MTVITPITSFSLNIYRHFLFTARDFCLFLLCCRRVFLVRFIFSVGLARTATHIYDIILGRKSREKGSKNQRISNEDVQQNVL